MTTTKKSSKTQKRRQRKHFSVMVQDEEVYKEFRKYVIRKYGKLHTVLALEVERALKDVMQKDVIEKLKENGVLCDGEDIDIDKHRGYG